jgi:hypothetical protein
MYAGLMSCMGERRGAYRVLQGNLRDRKKLGWLRHRQCDNIKTDI